MTISLSSAYQAHLDTESPTLGHLLKITRRDNAVYAFTSGGEDVTISGVTYSAAQGLAISSIATSAGLNVDNMELSTIDDGTLFTRASVLGGLWQSADFVLYRYNWATPSDGVEPLLAGTIGSVGLRAGVVVAELRGLQQYLQQAVGNVTTRTCRARFADFPSPATNNRCRLVAAAWTDSPLTVTAVTDRRTFSAGSIGGGATDANYAARGLILHCNGADTSTTVTDNSAAARTATVYGSAQISTAESVFGGASLLFTGGSDRVTFADDSAWHFGSGEFAVELRFRATSNSATAHLIGQWGDSAGQCSWHVLLLSGGRLAFEVSTSGVYESGNSHISSGGLFSAGSWNRLVFKRVVNVFSLELNGTSVLSVTANITLFNSSQPLELGQAASTSLLQPYFGYIDEVRTTKGLVDLQNPASPFADAAPGTTRPDDFYGDGIATWLTGANAGMSAKVRTYAASGTVFVLSTPMVSAIQVGDTLSAIAGCRHRLDQDCKTKFNNVLNFQGEPHLPGIDKLTALQDVSV